MSVYLRDPDVTLYHGDVLEQLSTLPDESVHCVVTSPPYWGLRDYGTGSWAGGDPACDHVAPRQGGKDQASEQRERGERRGYVPTSNFANYGKRWTAQAYRETCGKCGAQRTDQQLGLEPTPDLYIERMVAVFREVRRVLRRDGTCWLNIGDCSVNKQLQGMPWKLAFALQQDGWWLRADIIWSKPNPMPESVTDRPTKAHEYVFLLTRSPKYFFDQEAVREPHAPDGRSVTTRTVANGSHANYQEFGHEEGRERWPNGGRNVRSVWTIATEPYPDAHFATFPTELARRCILAGTSERGCCPGCGAPFIRRVERELHPVQRTFTHTAPRDGFNRNFVEGYVPARQTTETLGWLPSCDCTWPSTHHWHGQPLQPIPSTVMDPFVGSGTVPHVARLHNRHAIGIDLNADYLQLAARRLQQQSLFASSSTEGAV